MSSMVQYKKHRVFRETPDVIFYDISVDDSGAKRVDRLSTMCSRLYIKLTSDDYKKGENHSKNLIKFVPTNPAPPVTTINFFRPINLNIYN